MELNFLLSEALSHDQQRRTAAEHNMDLIASQDLGGFLLSCSIELSDESKQKPIRQMASTIIKNLILYTPKFSGHWHMLDQQIKNNIKEHVISTLASDDKDIRKAAALAVAGICKVELPVAAWPEIITILSDCCLHQNRSIQLSSITTLGYISQEIAIKDLDTDQLCKIFSALHSLTTEYSDEELIETAITALLNFIPFTKIFFENQNQKDLLLKMVYKCASHLNLKIRKISFQCLMEIARNYYDYLEPNLPDILALTELHMNQEDETVIFLNYEIWCAISDVEKDRIKNNKSNYPNRGYSNKVYKNLFEIIKFHLLQNTSLNEDDNTWSVAKSASCLLANFAQCCEYGFINSVIQFIGENITLNQPLAKEAALLAFGSILETIHRDNMCALVINSIDTIIPLLCNTNSSQNLKETTAWVLKKIAEFYGQEFKKHVDLFDKLYEQIFSQLFNTKKKVTCLLLNAIHFFVKNLKTVGNKPNMLSKHIQNNTLDTLLRLAFTKGSYDTNNNVAMACFFTIGSIIDNSSIDTKYTIQAFYQQLIAGYKTTLDPGQFPDNRMRYDYQGYFALSLEPCLLLGSIDVTEQMAEETILLIIQTFIERGYVYEEGLMAGSSLGLAIGLRFNKYCGEFTKYLLFALNNVKETSLCKTAIHSVSDLIRTIGTDFSKYINDFLPIIIKILGDNEADKNLKPHSFNVISDVFLVCKEGAYIFYDDVMELIGSALEAAAFLPTDDDDFDNLDYFESLREHIIECLMCIFHSAKDMNKQQEFSKYVAHTVAFINKINGKHYSPSLVFILF